LRNKTVTNRVGELKLEYILVFSNANKRETKKKKNKKEKGEKVKNEALVT
jgi:hypothetical protein